MRRPLPALFLALCLVPAFATKPSIQLFNSEDGAQVHCPMDKVVWLEPRLHLYYYRGSKHYANSGDGGFVCRQDAVAEGDKAGK